MDPIEAVVVFENTTDNDIIYNGFRYKINGFTPEGCIGESILIITDTVKIAAGSRYTFLSYFGPKDTSGGINAVALVKRFNYGKIIFQDSTYIDFCKNGNYPKSPYTNLTLLEKPNNESGLVYGYCVDEADHQYAIEHSGQE